jgi:hypothetical protein
MASGLLLRRHPLPRLALDAMVSNGQCRRAMRSATVLLFLLAAALLPSSASAATCSDYSDQAAAQRAADTRDADGDGIYCESLPCPCSSAVGGGGATSPPKPKAEPKPSCVTPKRVQSIGFSKTKYPTIRQHFLKAVAKGWPRTLVLHRPGASARRTRLLEDVPTRDGYDRDEYPPAVARGRGFHIRGVDPRGWKADVAYVPSSENRSHGSTMGIKLKRFCNGTKFRYVFY